MPRIRLRCSIPVAFPGCFSRLLRSRSRRCRFGVHCEQRSGIGTTRRCINHEQIDKLGCMQCRFRGDSFRYACPRSSPSELIRPALINGETHSQVRRGGLVDHTRSARCSRSQASLQPTWERVLRPRHPPGPLARARGANGVPSRTDYLSAVPFCTMWL